MTLIESGDLLMRSKFFIFRGTENAFNICAPLSKTHRKHTKYGIFFKPSETFKSLPVFQRLLYIIIFKNITILT